MIKKIVSVFAASVMVVLFMASCSADNKENSSTAASSEAAYSEVETSSVVSSEKQEISSEESSSEKEENSSLPESSRPQTSSRIEISRPTTSSRGDSVTLNVNAADAIGIGIYHFNTSWTKNYGDSMDDRFREFEDVLKAGYFNTVIVSGAHMLEERLWEICEKYKVSVWISLYSYFNSKKTTIDSYVEQIDKYISVVKKSPKKWELFCGFHHEENIWRGQSNADYLEVTRALYQKYGKRNFSVFATGEFTNYEGNQNQIQMDAANMQKINPAALKFTTDLSFDSYAVDVRTGAPNGGKYIDWQNIDPGIVDGESYYRGVTKAMLKLVEHDVNVWFFPCSYTTYLWGGVNGLKFADEAYCIAHLNFFDVLLKEQKFQGGLFLYTYTQFSKESEKGLQSHIVVEDESGKQLIQPEYTEKWEYYSSRLRELTAEYKKTKANHATFK